MNIQQKRNFGAGPSLLAPEVLKRAAKVALNWNDRRRSILEVSHRSSEFIVVFDTLKLLVKELLAVPEGYSILFLQGGASTRFTMVAQSFLSGKAAYLDSGYFAARAIKQARYFGTVEVDASSVDQQYRYIPDEQEAALTADYLHTTSNNTIKGTQIFEFRNLGVPLVCDMSSDILFRVIPVREFDLIYAWAQKNMGPAGMTLVIVKDELLDRIQKPLPAMADYRVYRRTNSLYNTPPVFPIYTAMLNMIWLKAQAGGACMEQLSVKKSRLLYQEINRNPLFKAFASLVYLPIINVTFHTVNDELETEFLVFAGLREMIGIKGFASVGGFRVSFYNALPLESVQALVSVMQSFSRHHNAELFHHPSVSINHEHEGGSYA